MWRGCLFLMGLAAFAAMAGRAADATVDRATLHGIKSMNVVVDPPGPELEGGGVTADMLRTRVEERLRRAGVALDPSSLQFLGVRVSAARDKKTAAVCAELGLYQTGALERDRNIKTVTETWNVDSVQLVPAKRMTDTAVGAVDALVDRFMAAYRSVN